MIVKIKYFSLVAMCICMFCAKVFAQQQTELTQNTMNILSYNPAFAGTTDAINFIATMRNQWTGFGREKKYNDEGISEGTTSASPMLIMVSAEMPIKVLAGGIGFSVCEDKIGLFNNISVNLGYAFQHKFIDGGKLGIGAQVKFDNIVFDKSGLIFGEGSDPILSQMTAEGNDFIVDCNFGIYYSKPNSVFAGISALNLIETHGNKTLYKEKRSYNIHGGYSYRFLTNPKYKITPSIHLRTDLSAFQLDINAIFSIQDKYWLGANYRINDGLGIILGLMWKDFKLGYSYDIPMSRLALGGNWGSHEVVLGYSFKIEKDRNKITQKNTRYL